MGALTSKQNPFGFRAWESRSYIEANESEIIPFRIRVEKLKTKRVRILPINFWMSNTTRFQPEKETSTLSSTFFKSIRYLVLNSRKLSEKRTYELLISNTKIYNKINSNIKKMKKLNINMSRKITYDNFNKILKINPKTELFHYQAKNIEPIINLSKESYNKRYNGRYEELLKKYNTLILLSNPRMESPTLNSFIYQNRDQITIESFSTFTSNYNKNEYPLTDENFNKMVNGKKQLTNVLIVKGLWNKPNQIKEEKSNTLTLIPLYLQNKLEFCYIPKNKEEFLFSIDFSYSSKEIYTPALIGVSKPKIYKGDKPKISVPLLNNNFDDYLRTKFNNKFLSRLTQLYQLTTKKNINKFKTSRKELKIKL